MKRILAIFALLALVGAPVAIAAPGDITLGTPRTQATLQVADVVIFPKVPRMEITFTIGNEVQRVVVRNGVCHGFSYAAGVFTPITVTVAQGFGNAMTAWRGAASNAAINSAVVGRLRTDGIISLTGTVE